MHPPTYRLGPDTYDKLERLADRVLDDGFTMLAPELAGIEEFAAAAEGEDPCRDAHEMRRSPKELYLLEALAFQVLDQVWRDAFNRTRDTLVVLPDCLSLHNPKCKKTEGEQGDLCARCLPECPAAKATELCRRYGATAVFAKRDQEALLSHHRDRSGDLGVVGVACVLMLAAGMRASATLGMPARGVLLEGCGCEHWNDELFGTRFALERLEAILAEKAI
jgi:hypothetical protein